MRLRHLAALAILASLAATPLAAQSPFQLSLFNPAQLVPAEESVSGVRLSILYTRNAGVEFIDLGFGFNHTTRNGTGLQWALVAKVDGAFTGWQDGLVAITRGRFTGLQMGAFTSAPEGRGVQLGWVNTARGWNGLQLGLVNITDHMTGGGLQVGLVNVIKRGGVAPVLPIVNFTF